MSAVAVYTMEEVAQRLHKSGRWLQDFVRNHPFYRLAGRTKAIQNNNCYEFVGCRGLIV